MRQLFDLTGLCDDYSRTAFGMFKEPIYKYKLIIQMNYKKQDVIKKQTIYNMIV